MRECFVMKKLRVLSFRRRNDAGFALIAVLWIAGLLSVLTAHLAVSVRTQLRVSANLIESAKAEALADAGVSLAIMDLMAARRVKNHNRRFPLTGRPVICAFPGGGAVAISVTDESAKIDVNSAGIPLLHALIAGLGEPSSQAVRIAEAIFDFRDADSEPRPNGAEAEAYEAAGLAWKPKNAALQSIEELGQIPGLSAELLAKMRPHISVYSGCPDSMPP